MKIKINNIFKNKDNSKDNIKESKNKININEDKSNIYKIQTDLDIKKVDLKPILKVYKKGGEIIKYDTNIINKDVEEKRVRSGLKLVRENIENNKFNENVHFERVKRKKRQKTGSKIPKNSYLLFLFMIMLAGASILFAYKNYDFANQESYAVYSSLDNKDEIKENDIQEQNSLSNNNDTKKNEDNAVKENTNNTVKSVAKTNNVKSKQTQKVVPLNFSKPINGEILKIYSKDKVIYSKTLELWKTHDGIDIKAEENAIVKSIEKGTIEKIYDDSFYGKNIVIDHGQGYKSSYSNLADEVFVKEKQVITKLTKIGKVGKSAIGEIKDETHLHFTLIKNNEISDPTSIFR